MTDLENLAMRLGEERISRRRAAKLFAAGVAGSALAVVAGGRASAASKCPPGHNPVVCGNGVTLCCGPKATACCGTASQNCCPKGTRCVSSGNCV